MTKTWTIAGALTFLVLTCIVFPLVLHIPHNIIFDADAGDYSRGTIHLLREHTYSLDGVRPTFEREPGQSVLLAVTYLLFGIERPLGVYLVQGLLVFCAALFFCHQFGRVAGSRAAGISFLLLLVSGSVLHSVFSAYREALALSLLLIFSGFYLWSGREPGIWKATSMGLLLGLLILTYYPFLFLPLFIAGFWLFEQRRRSHLLVLILCCVLPLSLWIARNGIIAGKFALIEGRRSGICWYVRGEQAEKATGLEPFRCLWSEYVSRDWSGRSDACSFNAVWHARWPEGQDRARADDIADAGREGQAKIRSHVLSYLWFSVFEVLEFHIPFVGGGWSHLFNMYASLTGAIMYVGCLFGLTRLRRKHLILLVIVGYTVAVFCLTDATPRYAVPILFCYSAIAGIGYDRLLTFLRIP